MQVVAPSARRGASTHYLLGSCSQAVGVGAVRHASHPHAVSPGPSPMLGRGLSFGPAPYASHLPSGRPCLVGSGAISNSQRGRHGLFPWFSWLNSLVSGTRCDKGCCNCAADEAVRAGDEDLHFGSSAMVSSGHQLTSITPRATEPDTSRRKPSFISSNL